MLYTSVVNFIVWLMGCLHRFFSVKLINFLYRNTSRHLLGELALPDLFHVFIYISRDPCIPIFFKVLPAQSVSVII